MHILETLKHNLLYVYADIKGQNVSLNCWKKKCTFESKASIQGRQGRKQMWFPIAATSGLWASIINRLWSLTPTHILALPHTNTSLLIFTWVLRMRRKCFWIKKRIFWSEPSHQSFNTYICKSQSFFHPEDSYLYPIANRWKNIWTIAQISALNWKHKLNRKQSLSFLCFNLFHL